MNEKKKKNKAVMAAIVIAAVTITGAFAYLMTKTGVINNIFTVGSSGAQLIETFDGKTYEGKVDDTDDGFADAVMSPGKTYEKTTKVKFTGTGSAFAFVKISVPNDTATNLVKDSGERMSGTSYVVTANFNTSEIATKETVADKWYKVAESVKSDCTEYVYGYTTKIQQNATTPTSPLSSVTVANVFINNNDFTGLKTEYKVPVTAYTVQIENETSLTAVWNATRYASE